MTPETLAQVHAAAFTDARPWHADEFAKLLETPGVILLGDVRSFLLGRLIADEAEVLTIATSPQFQRMGLAKTTLAAFLDGLKAQQARYAFLEVAEDNMAANALYSKAGFAQTGRRPHYYARPNGTKVAALVLQYDLHKHTDAGSSA